MQSQLIDVQHYNYCVQDFSEFDTVQIKALNIKYANTPAVILFASADFTRYRVYWKSSKIKKFMSLKAFKKSFSVDDKSIHEFISEFLVDSLQRGSSGVRKTTKKQGKSDVDIKYLADHRDYNMLLVAAESGRADLVPQFLKYGVEWKFFKNEQITAQTLAQEGKYFNVILALLKENIPFPPNLNIDECSEELKNFIEMSIEFHEMIKLKNVQRLNEIIAQNSNLKHFYNLSNESALMTSSKLNFLDMHVFLISRKLSFGPDEDENQYKFVKPSNMKVRADKNNRKLTKSSSVSHVNNLMTNTKPTKNENGKSRLDQVKLKIFLLLDDDPILEVILKAVAAYRDFEIDFNLLKDSSHTIDPWIKGSNGAYIYSGEIRIGAMGMLQSEMDYQTVGALAHELCHFALFATFQNNAKPFKSNDQQAEREFTEIIQICYKKKHKDKLIENVFKEYDKSLYPAELIVRPAQMIALYKDEPEILKQKMELFPELFDYFKNVIIPAIRLAIVKIEARYFLKSIKNFDELSEPHQNEIKKATVLYKKAEMKLNDVAKDNPKFYRKLKVEHMSQLLNDVIINLDDPRFQYLTEPLTLNWNGLTKTLKKKILNSDAGFRGETSKKLSSTTVQAEDVFGFQRTVINEDDLSKAELNKELKERCMDIFYMDRSFIPEDAKMIWFEVTYGHEYKNEFNMLNNIFANAKMDENKVEQFLKKSFDERCQIFDKIKENEFFKSINFNLNTENFKFMNKSISDLLEQGENDRILVLSDVAGSGKTLAIETMMKAIKEKYKAKWVSYIRLREYGKFLKTSGSPDDVLKLLEDILELNSSPELDKRIFEICFQKGRTIIFWNNFDEISPTYNEFVLNAIKYIYENTKNLQFVSTRPLYSEQLSRTFKVRPWSLVPFVDIENREYIQRTLVSYGVKSERITKKLERILKLVEDFNSKNHFSYKLYTPYILRLVAESNGYISYFKETNLFYIFGAYYEEKLKLWIGNNETTKDDDKRKELYVNLEKIYQKYALLINFGSYSCPIINMKLRKLQIMKTEIPKECPAEEIARMGILYVNGKNNFDFCHKIFVDLFVVDYFVKNIFEADNSVDSYEAELRLELFFLALKSDKINLKIILDIMGPCLANYYRKGIGNFCSKMSILFRTKFKNFLMHMLEIEKPEIFKVLIYFFKRDHEVLINLLHLNEPENLYTAIFNPNHTATYVDPEEIKRFTKVVLTDIEFHNLLLGKFQKGNIIVGMKFFVELKKYGDRKKSYARYDSDVGKFHEIDYWDFINNVKMLLNKDEHKVVYKNAANPKCYLFYDKMFTSYDHNKFSRYLMGIEAVLLKPDLQEAIGNALIGCLDMSPRRNPNHQLYLSLLMFKVQEYLTPPQIYEIFYKKSILHKAHYDSESLKQLWTFLSYHISPEERRKILLQDNGDDKYIYSYNPTSTTSKYYFHYDLTPFKIFHKSLTIPFAETFDFVREIYEEFFDDAEIREIILKPNDFLYYVIGIADEKYCKKFAAYMEELFKENESTLLEYFDRKMRNINMTAFEMMEDLRGMPYAQQKWFNNLKTMNDLRDRIKSRKNC